MSGKRETCSISTPKEQKYSPRTLGEVTAREQGTSTLREHALGIIVNCNCSVNKRTVFYIGSPRLGPPFASLPFASLP